jgi:hypothetical protein
MGSGDGTSCVIVVQVFSIENFHLSFNKIEQCEMPAIVTNCAGCRLRGTSHSVVEISARKYFQLKNAHLDI